MRTGERWSREETIYLRRVWELGMPEGEIAYRMCRPVGIVCRRARQLGLDRGVSKNRWTDETMATLVRGWVEGCTLQEIAFEVGGATINVENHIERLGLKKVRILKQNMPEVTTTRKCIGCGRPFPSWGAGNRFCPKCKKTEAWQDGGDVLRYPVVVAGAHWKQAAAGAGVKPKKWSGLIESFGAF